MTKNHLESVSTIPFTNTLSVRDELILCDQALSASCHGMFIFDISKPHWPIMQANPALIRMLDIEMTNITGLSTFDRLAHMPNTIIDRMKAAVSHQQSIELVFQNQQTDNHVRWYELGLAPIPEEDAPVRYYVGSLRDVSERQIVEEQLVKQATHDTLTNLPNRSLLIDRVERTIMSAQKEQSLFCLVFLDLDHFKLINDSLGHTIGDKLLLAVTKRLIMNTRDCDTVSRISGDEFVILLPNLTAESEAFDIIDRILRNIHSTFQIDQHEITLTASSGMSFYPRDGEDYHTLLKNSDLSMYYAKNHGRNNYQRFDETMKEQVEGFVELESGLRNALAKNEISIDYQPVISLQDHSIHSTEALMRWNHYQLGNVSPLKFIPVAEEIDLISDLSAWLLKEACLDQIKWHKQFSVPMTLSVNLSSKQIQQKNFIQRIKDILTETALPPEMLELELTESLLVNSMDETLHVMQQLKSLGVTISIDDFGTGYSSLTYLKKFPVDNLKIDRSFVQGIEKDRKTRDIIEVIIKLAHNLKVCVIAEGVETAEQLRFLEHHECDFAQGYLFYKPMTADEIQQILRLRQS